MAFLSIKVCGGGDAPSAYDFSAPACKVCRVPLNYLNFRSLKT